jgi:hypothetical protein
MLRKRRPGIQAQPGRIRSRATTFRERVPVARGHHDRPRSAGAILCRASMTPALFVEYGFGVRGALSSPALQLGHGIAAAPQVQACSPSQCLSGMAFTDPTVVLAEQAVHRRRIPSVAWAATICGTWITVCFSRWLSKVSPQGHLMSELGICDGSFSPRAHMAYFRSVQSR